MKNKKKLILLICILLGVVSLALASSYALFTFNVTKNTNFKIAIGTLELSISDTTTEDKFIMESIVPTKDEVALTQDGYTFTLSNTGTIDSYYTIYLDDILLSDAGERLSNSYIKLNLWNQKTNQGTTNRLSNYPETNRVLTTGFLKAGENITYTLRMWVDYNAGNEAQNKYFATQIRVVGTQQSAVGYQEVLLNGATPVLTDNLVPVKIAADGTVTRANIQEEWYSYEKKNWANAVVLKNNKTYKNGETIPEDNIESYFVWIPKYKYKLWDLGNYSSIINSTPIESKAQEIEIVFGTGNTENVEGVSCVAPMLSGESGECNVGEYMTHPAFISMGTNGLWVAKFETSGDTSDINVLPNVASLRNLNVKTMFELAYNYDRNLDSHMMKSIEWGAVAYLSHSKYGISEEIRINNSSTFTTGCAATTPALNYVGKSQTDHSEGYYNGCENAYNTSIGVLASTTGNITGIYDMSGGAWEYTASYRDGTYGSSGFDATSIALYDSKYFDVYPSGSTMTTYNNRILGDATGELGPFYSYKDSDNNSRYHSTWYADYSSFVGSSYPWFGRGGYYYNGVLAGLFDFHTNTGDAYSDVSFRIVLAPTK